MKEIPFVIIPADIEPWQQRCLAEFIKGQLFTLYASGRNMPKEGLQIVGNRAEMVIVDDLHQQIQKVEDLKLGEIYTAVEATHTNRNTRRAAAKKRRNSL